MKHKSQHTISQTYLWEWCDPSTPRGHEPYIWIAAKDGSAITNRAPKNAFSESDFYTVYDEAGNRDITLEHRLQKIEDGFVQVRSTIKDHKPINDDDMLRLVTYISAAYARTEHQKSDQASIWNELLDIYGNLEIDKRMPSLYAQVEDYKDQPMPFMLSNFMELTVPVLKQMNLSICVNPVGNGFITSDNPVVWIDPSVLVLELPSTFFGLGSPMLEILFPITPNHLAILSWSARERYIILDAESEMVDILNKLIVSWSSESVILNHNNPNPYWFSP